MKVKLENEIIPLLVSSIMCLYMWYSFATIDDGGKQMILAFCSMISGIVFVGLAIKLLLRKLDIQFEIKG